jgi:hypothetical protein
LQTLQKKPSGEFRAAFFCMTKILLEPYAKGKGKNKAAVL